MKKEPVDLGRLLSTFVDLYQVTADQRGICCLLEPRRPLWGIGMDSRPGQFLGNLLSNAESFSPTRGAIRLTARDGEAVIMLEDEGTGIPEKNLVDIFQRFYSKRPESEKFGTHSGLGLNISKQIIETHGGTFHAENQAREARFVMTLPLCPVSS